MLVICIIVMLGIIVYRYLVLRYLELLSCSFTPTGEYRLLEFLNILSLIISSLFYGTVHKLWGGMATHFLQRNSFSVQVVCAYLGWKYDLN